MIEIVMSIFVLAHTTCIESGRRFEDAEVVAQVAVNRAVAKGVPIWRVIDSSWNRGMPKVCRYPLATEHYMIAARARFGRLRVPSWARVATSFVAPSRECAVSRGRVIASQWRARGLRRVGSIVHSFYAPRPAVGRRRNCGLHR